MNIMKPLIKQLSKMIKEGYDLGKDQLPEVGKQILQYYFWVNILQSVIGLFGSLVFTKWTWVLIQMVNAANESMDGRWIGIFILGGITLGFAALAYNGIVDFLRVVIAPKLFLLDSLASYL